jgi:preprotein translocase subunit SecA
MVRYLWRLQPIIESEAPDRAPVSARRPAARRPSPMVMNKPAVAASPFGGGTAAVADGPRPARTGGDDVIRTVRHDTPKVGRNDPCPCGSGKKYKKCHGA